MKKKFLIIIVLIFILLISEGLADTSEITGWIQHTVRTDCPYCYQMGYVEAGDFNNNGNGDFVVPEYAVDRVAVYYYNETLDTYIRSVATFSPVQLDGTNSVLVDDFDGDNDLDFVANSARQTDRIYYANNSGAIGIENSDKLFRRQTLGYESPDPYGLTYRGCDMDGDGDKDFVSVRYGDYFEYWENDFSADQFATKTDIGFANHGSVMPPRMVDFDGDGDCEVMMADYSSKTIQFGNMTGGIAPTNMGATITMSLNPYGIDSADFDGDGDIDIIVSTAGNDKLRLFTQTSWKTFSGSDVGNVDNSRRVFAIDLNNDTYVDILTPLKDRNNITYLLNDGTGSFTQYTLTESQGDFSALNGIGYADMDGDGDYDVLASGYGSSDLLVWYENPTDPSLSTNTAPVSENITYTSSGAINTLYYNQVIQNIEFDGYDADNDAITLTIEVIKPDGTLDTRIDNANIGNTTGNGKEANTSISLDAVGNWTVNAIVNDGTVNTTGTRDLIVKNIKIPTQVNGFYGFDTESVATQEDIVNATEYGIDLIGLEISYTNFSTSQWTTIKDRINYSYSEHNLPVFLTISFEKNDYTDAVAECSAMSNLSDIVDYPYLDAIEFLVIKQNMSMSGVDTFTNAVAECIRSETNNQFTIYSKNQSTGLDTNYVKGWDIPTIDYAEIGTYSRYIDSEKKYLQQNTSLSRIYVTKDSYFMSLFKDYHDNIMLNLRANPNLNTNTSVDYFAEMTNGDLVVFNNQSSEQEIILDHSDRYTYDLWDYRNKRLYADHSSSTTVVVPAYSASYIFVDTFEKVVMTSNDTSTLFSVSQTESNEMEYSVNGTGSTISVVGAYDVRTELWDSDFVFKNLMISTYEQLQYTNIVNYNDYDMVIINLGTNTPEIVNTSLRVTEYPSILNKTFGYISVSDYNNLNSTGDEESNCSVVNAWETMKTESAYNWTDKYGINVFVDGFDIGYASAPDCFEERIKRIADNVHINKQKKLTFNTYTIYKTVSNYGDYVMRESCFSRWDGTVGSPTYSYEDFGLMVENSKYLQSRNIPVICMAFGDVNNYDKMMYDFMAFSVMYGANGKNLFRYAQPNFQVQREIRVPDIGDMLQSSYVNNSASDLSRRYENGIVHFNPHRNSTFPNGKYYWFDDGKTIENMTLTVKGQIYASSCSGGTGFTIQMFNGTDYIGNSYPVDPCTEIAETQWSAGEVTKEISAEYQEHGHYYVTFRPNSRASGTGTNLWLLANGYGGLHTWYDTGANNPPTTESGWTTYGRTGIVGDFGTTNVQAVLEINHTSTASVDDSVDTISLKIKNNIPDTDDNFERKNLTISGIYDFNIETWTNGIIMEMGSFRNVSFINTTTGIKYLMNLSNSSDCNTDNPTLSQTTIQGKIHKACFVDNSTHKIFKFVAPHLSEMVYQVMQDDVVAPTTSLINPDDGNRTTDTTPDFTFQCSENANATLYIDGLLYGTDTSVIANKDTTITASSPLTNGVKSWTVNCTDGANNTNTAIARNIEITSCMQLSTPSNFMNTSQTNETISVSWSNLVGEDKYLLYLDSFNILNVSNVLSNSVYTDLDDSKLYNLQISSYNDSCVIQESPPTSAITVATVKTNVSTSFYASSFNISDIILSGSDYVTALDVSFNTSKPQTNLVIITSMNVKRLTGSGIQYINIRINDSDTTLLEEIVKTITSGNNEDSIGTDYIVFNVSSGNHNLSMEFQFVGGNGSVEINDIDMVLGEFETTSENNVSGALFTDDYSFISTSLVQAENFTVTKGVESNTFFLLKQKFQKTTSGSDTVDCRFNKLNSDKPSEWTQRYLQDSSDIGSTSINYVDSRTYGSYNMTIECRHTDSDANVSINTSLVYFDTSDYINNTVENFYVSNPSTNLSNSVSYTAGTYNIANKTMTVRNGTGIFLTSSVIFTTTSGEQTPIMVVNESNNNPFCYSKKDRYLTGNTDVGNTFLYTICDNLTIGQEYTFNTWLVVPSGETVVVLDESFSGFEVTEIEHTIGNIPPIVAITSPYSGDTVGQTFTTNFTTSDQNGHNLNVSLYLEQSGVIQETVARDMTTSNTTFSYTSALSGDYNLTLRACELATDELFCSNTSIELEIDGTAPEIINTTVYNILHDSADVRVYIGSNSTTNDSGNITLYYGTETGNLNQTAIDASFSTEPSISLSSLVDNETYYIQPQICDIFKNCNNGSVASFTTLNTWCGDGVFQTSNSEGYTEECDGSDFNSKTCITYGYDTGSLLCDSACSVNLDNCENILSSGSGGGGSVVNGGDDILPSGSENSTYPVSPYGNKIDTNIRVDADETKEETRECVDRRTDEIKNIAINYEPYINLVEDEQLIEFSLKTYNDAQELVPYKSDTVKIYKDGTYIPFAIENVNGVKFEIPYMMERIGCGSSYFSYIPKKGTYTFVVNKIGYVNNKTIEFTVEVVDKEKSLVNEKTEEFGNYIEGILTQNVYILYGILGILLIFGIALIVIGIKKRRE